MSLLLFFGSSATTTDTDALAAIATHWAGLATLPALYLSRCNGQASLPYGVMSHLDATYDILASSGSYSESDHEEHRVQLAIWAGTAAESIRIANLARQRFRRASLGLGGREISCLVSRRLGPFEDPDRAGSESLAFGCFLELTIMCRSQI